MNHSKKNAIAGVGMLSFLVLLAGCATTRMPILLDPSFSDRQVTTVALLPIVDRRRDRSFSIDLDSQLGARTEKQLRSKGYEVIKVSQTEASSDPYGSERLLDMDAEYIASLGPPEADAVLAIYVDDVLSSYKVLVYEFKIEAIGTLVAKSDQKELWRDKGIGTQGQAGLISGLLQGMNRSLAMDLCVGGMLSALPKASAIKLVSRTAPKLPTSSGAAEDREAAVQNAVNAAASSSENTADLSTQGEAQ